MKTIDELTQRAADALEGLHDECALSPTRTFTKKECAPILRRYLADAIREMGVRKALRFGLFGKSTPTLIRGQNDEYCAAWNQATECAAALDSLLREADEATRPDLGEKEGR